MTVTDIQQLIDLLGEAPTVTELTVTAGDGSTATVKRRPLSPKPIELAEDHSSPATGTTTVAELSDTPIARPLSNVAATMVGIFHVAKKVIALGDNVTAGQRVGSIESMKIMNDVVSTAAGKVVEVLIEDGQPVEYGQVLFHVEPTEI